MEQEIWKPIKGFEDYEVSNKGRIRSLKWGKNKNLRLMEYTCGYYYVRLYINGNGYAKRIHRLVAKTFILNPHNKPHINHKNGIKTDNRVENLEWCTASENMIHAFKNGLGRNQDGENNHSSKLSEKEVKEIKQKYKINRSETLQEIASKYEVNYITIYDILNYRTWRHI